MPRTETLKSRSEKLFVGGKLRQIRGDLDMTQAALADALGLSPSYLNQLEHDQRPVTARVLMQLSSALGIDISIFTDDEADRVSAELREVLADPALGAQRVGLGTAKQLYRAAPELAQALLASHRLVQRQEEKLRVLDASLDADQSGGARPAGPSPLPYEEVRDFFHDTNNYVARLDKAAEQLSESAELMGPDRLRKLIDYLADRHGYRVDITHPSPNAETMYQASPRERRIVLNGILTPPTQSFQLAAQIGLLEQDHAIGEIIAGGAFKTQQAEQICRIALANYFAGALLMPYGAILDRALELRHDIERLQQVFGASFEQICHRLSNLQQPGRTGIPFFFVRVDQAGNITKRHSATKFQFARFGGACPLWNVHESFVQPGRISVQIAETPDQVKYLSIARAIVKRANQFHGFNRYYAVALGCEIHHADKVVYSDGIDLASQKAVTPIGVSCRICDRQNCRQRAFPPIDREIASDPQKRNYVPYRFE